MSHVNHTQQSIKHCSALPCYHLTLKPSSRTLRELLTHSVLWSSDNSRRCVYLQRFPKKTMKLQLEILTAAKKHTELLSRHFLQFTPLLPAHGSRSWWLGLSSFCLSDNCVHVCERDSWKCFRPLVRRQTQVKCATHLITWSHAVSFTGVPRHSSRERTATALPHELTGTVRTAAILRPLSATLVAVLGKLLSDMQP